MDTYELDEVYAVLEVLERVEIKEGLTKLEASLKHKLDTATKRIAKTAKTVNIDLTKYEKGAYREVLVSYPEY